MGAVHLAQLAQLIVHQLLEQQQEQEQEEQEEDCLVLEMNVSLRGRVSWARIWIRMRGRRGRLHHHENGALTPGRPKIRGIVMIGKLKANYLSCVDTRGRCCC